MKTLMGGMLSLDSEQPTYASGVAVMVRPAAILLDKTLSGTDHRNSCGVSVHWFIVINPKHNFASAAFQFWDLCFTHYQWENLGFGIWAGGWSTWTKIRFWFWCLALFELKEDHLALWCPLIFLAWKVYNQLGTWVVSNHFQKTTRPSFIYVKF